MMDDSWSEPFVQTRSGSGEGENVDATKCQKPEAKTHQSRCERWNHRSSAWHRRRDDATEEYRSRPGKKNIYVCKYQAMQCTCMDRNEECG